jgi:hypothetical protein
MLLLESTRPVTPILSVATLEGVDAGTFRCLNQGRRANGGYILSSAHKARREKRMRCKHDWSGSLTKISSKCETISKTEKSKDGKK